MIKKWKVTAELNMNASHYEWCIVEANSERKARMFAERKFKEDFKAFHVIIREVQLIDTLE